MKDKITIKIRKDIKKYEKKLKLRSLHNIGSLTIKSILKYGIFVDRALPYLVSGFILAYAGEKLVGNIPFHKDVVLRNMNIETIDSSYGYHAERETVDYIKYDRRIEYSTGWSINEEGLYTRTVTYFNIPRNVDLTNTNLLFSLSPEELKKTFTIEKVDVIKKEVLGAEDYMYAEDAVFVINSHKSAEQYQRYETNRENVNVSLIYLCIVLLTGYGISTVSHMYIKTPVRNRLKELESTFQPVSRKDIETIEKIIALKKENLSLFEENNVDDNSNFQLRKR